MVDKLEETVLDIKTPGLDNFETDVSTHNGFITHLVLIFSDLNKTQIYKMPNRDSPYHEIEKVMSFNYFNVFKANEHKEDYVIRKPNDESFLFEIGDKTYIYVGGEVFTFETNDTVLNYSSEFGFNDIKYPFAYAEEKIYFMRHQKNIPIQDYKNSTEKDEYQYLCKKGDENKGIVEYANDFFNCKIISDESSN